jgi:hypothetical protein
MANIQQKMENVRELIRAKRYAEARKLLQTIDHPTARSWIERIDSIAPQVAAQPPKRKWLVLTLALMLIVVIAAIAIVAVVQQSPPSDLNQRLVHEGIEVSYPDGWTRVVEGGILFLSSSEMLDSLDDLPAGFEGVMISLKRSFEGRGISARSYALEEAEGWSSVGTSGLTENMTAIQIGEYQGFSFSYRFDDIQSNKAYFLELPENNVLRIDVITADHERFKPRFEEIVRSLRLDLTQVSTFGCPIQAWWDHLAEEHYVAFLDSIEPFRFGLRTKSQLEREISVILTNLSTIETLERPECATDGIAEFELGLQTLATGAEDMLAKNTDRIEDHYTDAATEHFQQGSVELRYFDPFFDIDDRLRYPFLSLLF